MKKTININLILLLSVLALGFSGISNEETGWEYQQSTFQAFYMLENTEVDGVLVEEGDVIGYKPRTNSEFIIDGEKLYRVLSNLITIKYEHKGNEEAYNPSWAQSG